MAQPVVHFEIIGQNPDKLRNYFGGLFGWQFDTSSAGGGSRYPAHGIFYVGVPNVEAALAERKVS